MKKWMCGMCVLFLTLACVLMPGGFARAQESDTIKTGIYIGEINISGMTAKEAQDAVNAHLDILKDTELTLVAAAGEKVVVKAAEMGITWENPETIEQALQVGTEGNVIERYKIKKDLEHDNLVYPLEISYSVQDINNVLVEKCAVFDKERVDSTMVREKGEFKITEGQTGYELDVETSIDKVYSFLTEEWDYSPATIELNVVVDDYLGKADELAQVTDILGTCTTSYKTSGSNRSANVKNGCELINGTLLYPGEEFSALEIVTPFTTANGYYPAGSYIGGKVVDSLGGGICQVTTTLYNAVLFAELEVSQRYNHSMTVSYVELAMDAAIAESAGKDFKFVNNTEYPVYVEGFVKNKTITFNIYGKETRSADREIRYETEVKQVINSSPDIITADASRPIGYITSTGGYTGYKTVLWKIVTEKGEEVSRTQVNTSNYKMVQRTAVVGTATEDSWAYEEIMAAIGTANIDHVKNVIAYIQNPPVYDDEEEEW